MILTATPVQTNVDWSSLVMRMGWVDAVFLFAFALGVFLGLRKGLAKVLPGLLGVTIAQTLAVEYNVSLATFFKIKFQAPAQIVQSLAFAALALGAIFLVRFLFQFFSLLVNVEFKPPINNIGAAIVGGLQLVLFVSLISSFLMFFQVPFIRESLMEHSISGPYLVQSNDQVHDFFIRWFPESWRTQSSQAK